MISLIKVGVVQVVWVQRVTEHLRKQVGVRQGPVIIIYIFLVTDVTSLYQTLGLDQTMNHLCKTNR